MDPSIILLALGAGILSFSMPCNLIALPSFLVYLSLEKVTLKKAFIYILIYGLGFSLVFTSIGLALLFVPGFILQQKYLQVLGGAIICLLGVLFIVGVFDKSKNAEEKHEGGMIQQNQLDSTNSFDAEPLIPLIKPELQQKKLTYSRCFTLGISLGTSGFACVLPIFSPILVLIATSLSVAVGFVILMCYCLGMLLPFFILGIFLGKFNEKYLNKIIQHSPLIRKIFGVVLIILGILYMEKALVILGWI